MLKDDSKNLDVHYYSEQLQRKMKLIANSKAAVIEAPSGYGKTTVIRDYIKQITSEGDDVFWFAAIDEEAASVLYRRLCSEIEKIDDSVGKRLIEIDFPNAFTIGEVCSVLRTIRCKRKTLLVVDDFQYLKAILPPSFIYTLLDNIPEDLRIVVVTQMLSQEFQGTVLRLGIPYITASDLKWNAEDIRNYFILAGYELSNASVYEAEKLTDGWVIAVHLQLCSYYQTGAFSDEAVMLLMEHLIWDKMTASQRDFFMRASAFEACTIKRLCGVLNCDSLPDYAMNSISIPFIRYIPEQKLCVPHNILRKMVCQKRREQGEEFNKECLLRAGDVCRDEGEFAEAVFFYSQINDYEQILSLNLSNLICAEIGDRTFNDIASEIALNCSLETKAKYPHSMLCVAWAVRFLENEPEFHSLMEELDRILPESGLLRAEWLLLCVYLHYPRLEEMLDAVTKASELFGEDCSSVILPEVPWAFYEYIQLTAFHIEPGQADKEADIMEKFINIYSKLTNGHGAGADVLYRAELYFFRCETGQAEIFAHKAVFLAENKKQKGIQVGATRLLAVVALLKSDLDGWQSVVSNVESAVLGSVQNTTMFRRMLDIVYASLLVQLREYESIADWLKNTEFLTLNLPAAILIKAIEMHGYYLMGTGEYAQLVGFLESVESEKYTPFPAHFHLLTTAVGYSSLENIPQTFSCMELAAEKAIPDDMLHCFVGFSRLLDGLSDELIEKDYPDYLERFNEYKKRYFTGWFTLFNAISQNELPGILTGREREIAELAAEGLRNIEIAEKLFLSEHTIRAHLRSIYQKLDIDRRAKLVKILK
ncbi:MAG: LuxR C-terminal-related transcriptional regulator [Oscillospiraceae bacterium]|nr:LuxR C-terminal-related transcriptional regulator [Oscillospiraceae bacterium]